ncbi:hypothetical protein tb265_41520 [Gemmatimonadetes bacterium T265]|nr:hypothetical protein tb265_41520 [Gemmatimonadetes bacterium T265]
MSGGPASGGPASGGPASGGPASGGPASGGPASGGPASGGADAYAAPAFAPYERFHATTSIVLDGYDVVEVLGLVRGITVRSRSVFGRLGAGFQQIFGGEISLLTELCEQTRSRAFEIAVEHAQALGANALIALRYDATEIMSGVSEVLCYGTAVRVVPRAGPRDAVTVGVARGARPGGA